MSLVSIQFWPSPSISRVVQQGESSSSKSSTMGNDCTRAQSKTSPYNKLVSAILPAEAISMSLYCPTVLVLKRTNNVSTVKAALLAGKVTLPVKVVPSKEISYCDGAVTVTGVKIASVLRVIVCMSRTVLTVCLPKSIVSSLNVMEGIKGNIWKFLKNKYN